MKPQRVPPRRAHDGLIIKKTRSGLGLITRKPIRRKNFIIEYFGPYITNDEADKRFDRYLFEVNSYFTVDGKSRTNIARYINHSCRPNCEITIRDRRIFLYAKRAILAEEELTYDYGKDYFDEFIKPHGCRCEKCRFKRKDVQRVKKPRR